LTLAINGGSVALGAKLLSAYSIGLAVPFLAAALGIGWVMTILRKYNKVLHYVEMAMGVVLVFVGVLLFAGVFELLARYGYYVNFGI
jgi:cytochrome c-type biogenesis protein